MKKNAFTLIELLAAITILALLVLIAVPAVSKQLNDSKDTLYNSQISNIKTAAQAWGADNLFKLPEDDTCVTVTLGYLKDLGYLDVNITNPKTGEEFSNTDTFVNIQKSENSYTYEVKTSGDKCSLVDSSIEQQ